MILPLVTLPFPENSVSMFVKICMSTISQ
jgi:hypothetical protein